MNIFNRSFKLLHVRSGFCFGVARGFKKLLFLVKGVYVRFCLFGCRVQLRVEMVICVESSFRLKWSETMVYY
uniref:Uncharacterized protein n=1 Tax=Rhizophora mucronata TaxID=61149 RepID=A0A2P2IWD9_RHIMU